MTQTTYIEILLNDVGFGERFRRNAYLSDLVGRDIHFIDELTTKEKSLVISELKKLKED